MTKHIEQEGQEPELSAAWKRELARRIRDADDPVRYMLVSEYGRKFILYYDVSDDVFVMNAPQSGTLFKRREAAERVAKLLKSHVHVVKYTTKDGHLRRLSSYRGPAWARTMKKRR